MRSRFPTILLTPAILLGSALVASCGDANANFASTVSDHVSAGEAFTLDALDAPVKEWTSVYVACPYAVVDEAPAAYRSALATVDTSNEGSQWLVFTGAQDTKLLTLDRTNVDFCGGTDTGSEYQRTQKWTAHKPDSGTAWSLFPAPETGE